MSTATVATSGIAQSRTSMNSRPRSRCSSKRVMRLAFCAACGVTEDLQHHHLVTGPEGGSDDERNLMTLRDP